MAKYYHYIIENIKTGKRSEIIVKNKRPHAAPGYKIIGCCGYHEKKGTSKNEQSCTGNYKYFDGVRV